MNGRGEAALVKRSVTIAGHRTSISLEPVFWTALVAAAAAQGRALNALVAEIDEARTTNLSSAIRVWLFDRAGRGEGSGGWTAALPTMTVVQLGGGLL